MSGKQPSPRIQGPCDRGPSPTIHRAGATPERREQMRIYRRWRPRDVMVDYREEVNGGLLPFGGKGTK